jgi:hypothetical protein
LALNDPIHLYCLCTCAKNEFFSMRQEFLLSSDKFPQ